MLKTHGKYVAFAAVIAAISLLVVFGTLGSSATYNYCVGHNGQHDTGQTDQKGAPVIQPAISNPSPVNLFIHCGGIYANENGTGITALATILLTIVTGLLGYLAWDQGRTSRAQLRAYIVMRPFAFGYDGVNQPIVRVVIKNIGQTPALDVETRWRLDILEYTNAMEQFIIPELPPSGQPIFPLQPQQELDGPVRPIEGRVFSTGEIAGAIVGKNLRLHAYGYAKYRDCFGGKHETPFVVTCSGGPGLRQVFNCVEMLNPAPRFENRSFDRKLT